MVRNIVLNNAEALTEAGNYEAAHSLLIGRAEAGDPAFQYGIGMLCARGHDLSPRVAAEWLSRAASGGHAEAFYELTASSVLQAHMDVALVGVAGHERLLFRAAELGSTNACAMLGVNYATGDWGEKTGAQDNAEAVRWYAKAAAGGNNDSRYNLGTMVLNGEGCEQDVPSGLEMIQSAALAGHWGAMKFLVGVYREGSYGTTADADIAQAWEHLATADREPAQ